METPEEIARAIGRRRCSGSGRVGWVHPDCGFWMLALVADRKIAALARGRRASTWVGK